VKPNMQKHLDTLGIGGAEYVSELFVTGTYRDTVSDLDLLPRINPAFYFSLRWV
jgi:hypothetical protein